MDSSDQQIAELVRRILAEDSRKVSRVYGKDGTVITTSQQWLVEPGHIMRVDHFELDGKAPVFTHIRYGSQLYGSYEGDIRLNNEYINGVDLPEGFRTASSGLILPESVFETHESLQASNLLLEEKYDPSPRWWQDPFRSVWANLIFILAFVPMVLLFAGGLFVLIFLQKDYPWVSIAVIPIAAVIVVFQAYKLLGSIHSIWMKKMFSLALRVEGSENRTARDPRRDL